MSDLLRIELEGRLATAEELWSAASAFGHFTAMQVRGGRTRGLALHLRRLEAANHELFAVDLDGGRVRELIRHALGGVGDASVRVYVVESGDEPAILVTVKQPGGITTPQSLQSVTYQRPEPQLKHLATGQGYYLRLAQRNGFDDALLTGPDGIVSESAIANVGLLDGPAVVWPDAPQLQGITMQLLERVLPELGIPSRRTTVRLRDLAAFDGVFLSNARGVAAVSRVDETTIPAQTERMATLAGAYESVPWDSI